MPAIAAAFSDHRNVSVPPVSSMTSPPRPLVQSRTSAFQSGVRRQLIVTSAPSERPRSVRLCKLHGEDGTPPPVPSTSAVRPGPSCAARTARHAVVAGIGTVAACAKLVVAEPLAKRLAIARALFLARGGCAYIAARKASREADVNRDVKKLQGRSSYALLGRTKRRLQAAPMPERPRNGLDREVASISRPA